MYNASSSVYAANNQARSICSQKASLDNHIFTIGTCSLHEDNEINIIEYQEDTNSIVCNSAYNHPEQVWGLETSTHDSDLFISSWLNKSSNYGLTLWRMPERVEGNGNENQSGSLSPRGYTSEREKLQRISDFDVESHKLSIAKWHHMKDTIIVSNGEQLTSYSIAGSDVKINAKLSFKEDSVEQSFKYAVPAVTWDPHSAASICATAVGSTIHVCDVRKMEVTATLKNAHDGVIRDIDYNPNKPSTIITCGDDRRVKFWDIRHFNSNKPLKVLEGHSNSVCSVKYNPFHDQLLLSGGSDETVCLWRIASCSSALWLGGDDNNDSNNNNHNNNNGGNRNNNNSNNTGNNGDDDFNDGNNKNKNEYQGAFEEYYQQLNETLIHQQGINAQKKVIDRRDTKINSNNNLYNNNLYNNNNNNNYSMSNMTVNMTTNIDPPDVKVRHIDQHEDSVYSVAWSAADAWIYASLSYDGRVIVNHVPSTEKYKILL